MGIHRRVQLMAVIAAATLAGIATPAHAQVPKGLLTSTEEPSAVNTIPPEEPEEAGLIEDYTPAPLPEETGVPGKPGDTTNAPSCVRHAVYTPKTKGGRYHKGVGPTNANYNGTTRTARTTFTSEATGEVGVSVTAGLETSVGTMVSEIEAEFSVNLSVKLTAKLGNSVAVDTPPKKTTHGKYGVYRLKNTGTSYVVYSNCKTSTPKTITSYTPLRVGWYIWES